MGDKLSEGAAVAKLRMSSDEAKRLVAVGLLAAFGAGLVVYAYLALTRTSDEPPIRVRGGSIDAEVAWYWQDAGGGKWDLVSDGYAGGAYFFKLVQSGGDCRGSLPAQVTKLRLEHAGSASEDFTFQSNGSKTRVTTQGRAKPVASKSNLLSYANGDFVNRLWAHDQGGGQPYQCTFERGEFKEACLCKTAAQCTNLCN